jgi:protein associated with RNAse G/E
MCDIPLPFITKKEAIKLGCVLGINFQVISPEEWRRSLEKEGIKNWRKYCDINSLAMKVRDNLYSNRNYYRGGRAYFNPAIVRVGERCFPYQKLPNYFSISSPRVTL